MATQQTTKYIYFFATKKFKNQNKKTKQKKKNTNTRKLLRLELFLTKI